MKIRFVERPLTRWDGKKTYKPVVYFICEGGVVIYIGSTNMLSERMNDSARAHVRGKEVWYFETNTRGEAYDCEYYLIEKLTPSMNGLRASRRYNLVSYPPFFAYQGRKFEQAAA